jgi:membrane protein implicated in regulation of membrane protease activity
MDPWILWLIAAVVLAVGEIFTLSFFLAPFAGGALVAALVTGLGGGDFLTWAAFIVVSFGLLAALRPLAKSHKHMPESIRTGSAALIGRTALVVERVHADGGSARIEGDVWTARPLSPDAAYEPGTRVQVADIKGATALVSEAEAHA